MPFSYVSPSAESVSLTCSRYSVFASRRSWHSLCAPWQVEQMFIISSAPSAISRWASANVCALSVSASSWLCSTITPAPQQAARSSSTSSMSSSGATLAIDPCSSGVKPRLTQPGQYATFTGDPTSAAGGGAGRSCVRAPLGRRGRGGPTVHGAGGLAVAARAVALAASLLVVRADDVQVELEALVLGLDGVEDPAHLVDARDLVAPERARRRHLAAHDRPADHRQRV